MDSLDHARIGSPSSAGVWGRPGGCTAFPTMAPRYPDLSDKSASEEGTLAHSLAEQAFREGLAVPVCDDPDMVAGILEYLNHIRPLASYCDSSGVEMRLDMPEVFEGAFGTVDFWGWHENSRTAYVRDFKYGLEAVDAYENLQLAMYAEGLRELFPQAQFFDVGIVQPRGLGSLETIRLESIPVEHLQDVIVPQLRDAAHEAADPQRATARSGSHCRRCPARHDCPAALTAAGTMLEATSGALPLELTPAAMGANLAIVNRSLEHLKSLSEALQLQLTDAIQKGTPVEGWYMEPKPGRLAWSGSDSEVLELGRLMGVDLAKPESPITPTQALALFKKSGIDGGVITGYSSRTVGAKLAPINFNKFKKVFRK